jgi:hypothetical protein
LLPTIGLAFLVILLMLVAILVFIATMWQQDRLAAWLLAPYAAWVAFASLLNGSIWALNGHRSFNETLLAGYDSEQSINIGGARNASHFTPCNFATPWVFRSNARIAKNNARAFKRCHMKWEPKGRCGQTKLSIVRKPRDTKNTPVAIRSSFEWKGLDASTVGSVRRRQIFLPMISMTPSKLATGFR